jgi:hypothetical protein
VKITSPCFIEVLEARIAPAVASIFYVANLDGANGVKISGNTFSEHFGAAVSSAGDFNGDGFDDLLIASSPRFPTVAEKSCYVIFGSAENTAIPGESTALNGRNGFQITSAEFGYFGHSVESAGDVNGDGLDDIIIGAYRAPGTLAQSSGVTYVVFGQAGGFPAALAVEALDGRNGFALLGGAARHYSAASVSSAGDVNGDGFDDVIIGAPGQSFPGGVPGAAYIVFGKADGFVSKLDFSQLDGTNGFRLEGAAPNDRAGQSVSDLGDINGDGFADVIISAEGVPNPAGVAYVVFGKASGFPADFALSSLDGTNGFMVSRSASVPGDSIGKFVSRAGDLNADGYDDFIVGERHSQKDGFLPGRAFVVFGRPDPFPARLDLASLGRTDGFRILGAPELSYYDSVTAAGDVNGDGIDDLLIEDGDVDYLLFGRTDQFPVAVDVSAMDRSIGMTFVGVQFNGEALDISAAGDINGDGFADLVGGAANEPAHGYYGAGAAYVILGGPYGGTLPEVTITNATVTEGNDGKAMASFSVQLSHAGNAPVAVQYSTRNDTATGGEDYTPVPSSTLVFEPGEVSKQINITIRSDIFFENDESFFVELARTVSGSLIDSRGVGTIRNDDANPAVLDVSGLNGTNGFLFDGGVTAVSDAGDINGDGFADAIFGRSNASPHGYRSGAIDVIFGRANASPPTVDSEALDGTNGFQLSGTAAEDRAGSAVSRGGDVNGDGFDDLIVSAQNADPNGSSSGACYVIFGRATGFPPNLDLADLDGSNGFKMSGVAPFDHAGFSIGAGDFNGDGFTDVLVGTASGTEGGAAYVVYGKGTVFPANVNLKDLDGANGFKMPGPVKHQTFGSGVAGLGDLNADGLDDFAVYAAPITYVVFGNAAFPAILNVAQLNGSNGFKIVATNPVDESGRAKAAGDVNGDGLDDLIVAAINADENLQRNGASYVIFGKRSGFSPSVDLSTLDGASGFKLAALATGLSAGSAASGIGDFNHDGFADVIIGASQTGFPGIATDRRYVVFGHAGTFPAKLELGEINGVNGVVITGAPSFADIVSAAGDMNNDGFGDLILGARVIFGAPSLAINDLSVTESEDEATTAAFEVSLSAPSPYVVTVQYRLGFETADAGDFIATSAISTVTFSPGEVSKFIGIPIRSDAAYEGTERFAVVLSSPTNATLSDALGEGTILNDDAPVTISSDGKRAIFYEPDGDTAIVKTTGKLVPEQFVFGNDGALELFDLARGGGGATFANAKLSIIVKSRGETSGDGMVNIGAIHARGINLNSVAIEGALGTIEVGSGVAGEPAINHLLVTALGDPSRESIIAGSLGRLRIEGNLIGTIRVTGGAFDDFSTNIAAQTIGRVIIRGDVAGLIGAATAGLIDSAGSIGSITIEGSVIGSASRTGIASGGSIGTVKVAHEVRSLDPAHPVTISALGDVSPPSDDVAPAIARLSVGGDLINAQILAGYARDLRPSNPDANIGVVHIGGDLRTSSIVAGVVDATANGFGNGDELISGDRTPALFARIAQITISGSVAGSNARNDHFAIIAQQLGQLTIARRTIQLTPAADDLALDPLHDDFNVVDFT